MLSVCVITGLITGAVGVGSAMALVSPKLAGGGPVPIDDPTTVVLTGHLLRNGTGVAGDVIALAWPKATVLAAAPEQNSPVDTKLVWQGTAAADGSFKVSVALGGLTDTYLGTADQLDLEIIAADATKQADWFTSTVRAEEVALPEGATARTGWTTQAAVAAGDLAVQDVKLDLGTAVAETSDDPLADQEQLDPEVVAQASAKTVADGDPVVPTLNVQPRDERVMRQGLRSSAAGVAASDVTPADVCVTYSAGDSKNRREYFAALYAWGGALASIDFNAGSHHQLGVAFKTGDTWSASGTSGIETAAGATVSRLHDVYPVNKVNSRSYKNICWTSTMWKPLSFYAILPNGEFLLTTHKTYSHCSSYADGAEVWKNKGKNVTYASGVDLPSINVSAQSGWNAETKVKFTVTKNTWICGNTSDGWAKSPKMEAHKR